MISGLEFICEADPDGHEVSPGVVASHKAFRNGQHELDSDPMEGMEIETSYPGDSEDIDIWRRKSSDDDTAIPSSEPSDRRKSISHS